VREADDSRLAVSGQRNLTSVEWGGVLEQRRLTTPREDDPSRSVDFDELAQHAACPDGLIRQTPPGRGSSVPRQCHPGPSSQGR